MSFNGIRGHEFGSNVMGSLLAKVIGIVAQGLHYGVNKIDPALWDNNAVHRIELMVFENNWLSVGFQQ